MEPLSAKLHGHTGPNPFHEAQAKTFGDEKLVREFYPTSAYLSLFNEGHEILLGSRGSGKTAILRMLSYSCLKQISHPAVKDIVNKRSFFGFYVPLHLEFMASLPQDSADGSNSTEYFQFAFNCAAAKSLLNELRAILASEKKTAQERLELEATIVGRLTKLWLSKNDVTLAGLEDLSWEIDCLYYQQAPWKDGHNPEIPQFAKHLFAPLLAALPQLTRDLELDFESVNWIACVDEAEFLKPAYLRCFNSFMRSEKRPIVLKLATLPFRYTTLQTLRPGISVEPNGNDFNFRAIDLAWDSEDFRLLADHIADRRLHRTGTFAGPVTIDAFLGKLGDDDPKDYYRAELGEYGASDEAILTDIVDALSPERQARFEAIKENRDRVTSDYYKKFSPVYYVRRMRLESSKGNRSVGWFAGPSMLRRVADGNPRRLIQVLHDLFEEARASRLTAKRQHKVIADFCDRDYERAAGLPEHGLLLDGILDTVGRLMEERVHGKYMIDGGINFFVQPALLQNEVVRGALELGVAYSFLFIDKKSLLASLSDESEFRVAHLIAVKFWLPMRKGSLLVMQSRHAKERIANQLLSRPPSTARECKTALGTLQLQLFDTSRNDE